MTFPPFRLKEAPMQALVKDLRAFRLAGMAQSLEDRLAYAQTNKLNYHDFLSLLCEDEKSIRKENNYRRRLKAARLPLVKRLEDFDFTFQPSLDEKLIQDLATCRFVASRENLILMGDSGTGKSHLAIGLAYKALEKEYTVYFTTVSDMLYQLHVAKADNSHPRKLKQLLTYDLLILDELGFKPIPDYAADDFFSVIAKRYEQKSLIITTNKKMEDWNDIFKEDLLTRAIVDRLIHHATLITIQGKSYRRKNLRKQEVI